MHHFNFLQGTAFLLFVSNGWTNTRERVQRTNTAQACSNPSNSHQQWWRLSAIWRQRATAGHLSWYQQWCYFIYCTKSRNFKKIKLGAIMLRAVLVLRRVQFGDQVMQQHRLFWHTVPRSSHLLYSLTVTAILSSNVPLSHPTYRLLIIPLSTASLSRALSTPYLDRPFQEGRQNGKVEPVHPDHIALMVDLHHLQQK